MAMIAITTNSSIRVNPRRERMHQYSLGLLKVGGERARGVPAARECRKCREKRMDGAFRAGPRPTARPRVVQPWSSSDLPVASPAGGGADRGGDDGPKKNRG